MVVGLLAMQSRRATSQDVRAALADAMERVSILAQARRAMLDDRQPNLAATLRQLCEALHAQAEPRSILVSFHIEKEVEGLSAAQILTLALVVNELATNAIKHAFEEEQSGSIRVVASATDDGEARITLDDDGLPFPKEPGSSSDGLGLGLASRLMASIGGALELPPSGSKTFALRVAPSAG
jgi:two-component sensor histidine kinase